jgi:hypothetical protein
VARMPRIQERRRRIYLKARKRRPRTCEWR